MSINRDASVVEYARNLTAESYPGMSEVPGTPAAFRRRWTLRVGRILPSRDVLQDMVKSFGLNARRVVVETLQLPVNVELALPAASSIRLDDYYLVIEIDCPRPEIQKGDEAAIATMGILQAADAQWQILDIQGIPRRYWFIFGRPHSEQTSAGPLETP